MKITIESNQNLSLNRDVQVTIEASELAYVYLHVAYPAKRNKTRSYMRRHRMDPFETVNPNIPVVPNGAPPKLPIRDHIESMLKSGMMASCKRIRQSGNDKFGTEPVRIAVPISDLVANLLRPCFHINQFGRRRLFYFLDEPIDRKTYFCVCCYDNRKGSGPLGLHHVRFDSSMDMAYSPQGADLVDEGLVWAAALVPLVVGGKALTAIEIAKSDYDLRHILGRNAEEAISKAYEGWYDAWESNVTTAVEKYQQKGLPFASFYHSILCQDSNGNFHVVQTDGALPLIAEKLAADGMTAAGLLDSGGSCAVYDVRMGSYLNHGWYFREPRGSILVFELNFHERIPLSKISS